MSQIDDNKPLKGTPYTPGPRFLPKEGKQGLELRHVPKEHEDGLDYIMAGNTWNPDSIHFIFHGGGVCADHGIPTAARLNTLMPDALIIMPNAPHKANWYQDQDDTDEPQGKKLLARLFEKVSNFSLTSRWFMHTGPERVFEEDDAEKRLSWTTFDAAEDNDGKPGWQNLVDPAKRAVALIDSLCEEHDIPLSKVSGTGFSQGTGLLLTICNDRKLGAVVAQSGPVPSHVHFDNENHVPLLFITGGQDETNRTRINPSGNPSFLFQNPMNFGLNRLKLKLQYGWEERDKLTTTHYPDMAHVTTSQSRDHAARWIMRTLKGLPEKELNPEALGEKLRL